MKYHGIFGIVLLLSLAPLARGQTFELLHSFDGKDGRSPRGKLVQGGDGFLYGTTSSGGANSGPPNYFGSGTVFRINTNGMLTTLVSFDGTNGSEPCTELFLSMDGNFYGTTARCDDGTGTVFKLTPDGILTTLATFQYLDGAAEKGGLLQDHKGNFYGTASAGGDDFGTIFRMTSNGVLSALFSFGGTNGAYPVGGLLDGKDGFLYGTTRQGGENDLGTFFKITTNGALTTLFSFSASLGTFPAGNLLRGSDGFIYGTTTLGAYRVNTNGAITVLNTIPGLPSDLIEGSTGNFYGTTEHHGTYGIGAIVKVTANGGLTTLHSFAQSDGSFPHAGILQGGNGYFYGTTDRGGSNNLGTVYRFTMVTLAFSHSGHELVLSWPTNALGFTLQSASDFHSSTNWIDFTNAPAVVGAQFTITNSVSANAQFYRLKKP